MNPSIILTDLDNTIYNWVDYFAPCFRAMVHCISKETGIGEDTIIDDFKRVYYNRGSLEYSFSVQELEICRNMSPEETKKLIRYAKGAFHRVREKNLKAYHGVKETLKWAKKEGIQVIGVTNAPVYHAQLRLKQLYLDHLFTGLAGWEGHIIPDGFLTSTIKQQVEAGARKYSSKIKKENIWKLSTEELKPSPLGYLKVINYLNVSPEATYVIGDNLKKDIRPAIAVGTIGIWAKYGLEYEDKNWQTLVRITHWNKEEISSGYNKKVVSPTFEEFKPTFVINAFSELREIIPPRQPQLSFTF